MVPKSERRAQKFRKDDGGRPQLLQAKLVCGSHSSTFLKPGNFRHPASPGSTCRDLVRTSCQDTAYGDLMQRHFIQILLQRSSSCQDTAYGDLVQRHFIEILLQISCHEVSYRYLANRALLEILYGHLARTPFMESLCGDISQRSCCRDLAMRSPTDILPTELLQRSCTEIS